MKKLTGLFITLSALASLLYAVNFSGHQSLNGLQITSLFTAPVTGPYFIKGTLSLPMASHGVSPSAAAARILKNSSVIYQGVSGATGFSMSGVALNANDVIKVGISSDAAVDQGLNVIKGDVFFGNGL